MSSSKPGEMRGGQRPNKPGERRGGRKPGTPNKTTASVREALILAFQGIGGVAADARAAQRLADVDLAT
jgi:hypothetical protein